MTELRVQEWGEGVPAVLVHGSIETGEGNWQAQRPLGEQGFRLIVPDRRAYSPGAEDEGEDFLQDAEDVAELLGAGAHLVGHSYGGIAAMFAAAKRPEAVFSLALIEPPAFGLRRDDPAVAGFISGFGELTQREELSDREFLEAFLRMVGQPPEELPGEMLDHWVGQTGPLRWGRPPWEVDPPLDELAAAPFPKVVFSGGHDRGFDVTCDEVTRRLGAKRVVLEGAGHEVQMLAEPFNQALLDLWSASAPG